MRCRHCGSLADLVLVDLGTSPPANAFLDGQLLSQSETWFPLRVVVCESCWLVQTEDVAGPEKYFTDDYVYFSGFSSSWAEHCKRYAETMTERFGLNQESIVVEVAANDGTLLRHFSDQGMTCTESRDPYRSLSRARWAGQGFAGRPGPTCRLAKGRCRGR